VTDAPDRCEFDSDALIVRLDLTLAADVSAISPAVEQILSIVGKMGCGAGKEFEIETALREALANAIVHGCKEDRAKTVNVSVGCDDSRGMIIVVRDSGEGFDPAELPNPVIGEQIYEDHGRGIFLINRLMDEVRFRARGTEIWMRKDTAEDG
jgi:serine/threonine-protein kinase RsbW